MDCVLTSCAPSHLCVIWLARANALQKIQLKPRDNQFLRSDQLERNRDNIPFLHNYLPCIKFPFVFINLSVNCVRDKKPGIIQGVSL